MAETIRRDVYDALDGERRYQDDRVAEAQAADPHYFLKTHPVTAYLVFMEDYLREALHIQARDWTPECDERTLEVVRKVTALGVACMEKHGAPRRKGYEDTHE